MKWLRRSSLWSTVVTIAMYVPCFGAVAQESGPRAALVNPGPELERATRAALEPWHVSVIVLTESSPGPTAPRANAAARELALRHRCAAVVWISQHDRDHALWVYDLAADQVVARRLTTRPPFDGPMAAAVALSIKTLLRHSVTAPASERYGAARATPEPAPEPVELGGEDESEARRNAGLEPRREDSSEPRSSVGVAPQRSARFEPRGEDGSEPRRHAEFAPRRVRRRVPAPSQGSAAAQARVDAPARAPARPIAPSYLDLEATVATRSHFTDSYAPEARFGAGATWWPRAGYAGLSLRAALGPRTTVTSDAFRGHLFDTTIRLAGQLRRDVLSRMRLLAAAGAAGEVTVLRGHAKDAQEGDVLRRRLIPALTVELGADWLVAPRFKAGVRAGAAWLIYTQRYVVDAQPVLSVSSWTLEGSLVLALCLGK